MSIGYPDYARLSLQAGQLLQSFTFTGGTPQATPSFYAGNFPYLMVSVIASSVPEYIILYPDFADNQAMSNAFNGTPASTQPNATNTVIFSVRGPWCTINGQFWSAAFAGTYQVFVYGVNTIPGALSSGSLSLGPWVRLNTTIPANTLVSVVPQSFVPGSALVTCYCGAAANVNFQAQLLEYNSSTWTTYHFQNLSGVNTSSYFEIPLPSIPFRFSMKNNNTSAVPVQMIGIIRSMTLG